MTDHFLHEATATGLGAPVEGPALRPRAGKLQRWLRTVTCRERMELEAYERFALAGMESAGGSRWTIEDWDTTEDANLIERAIDAPDDPGDVP